MQGTGTRDDDELPVASQVLTVGETDPAAPGTDSHGALARGEQVGRYVVLDRIGAGAMGVVHVAYDPELDRRVALKLIHTSLGAATRSHARLLREAQALARLSHPNVVTVHGVESARGRVVIAMEYVEGMTLGAWLRDRPRIWRETLPVMVQAGRGLAAAHAAGLVHRDFKPDNVMIDRDGRVRVMDLGLARRAGTLEPDDASGPSGTSDILATPLTRTGMVVGTPAYMAPEQLSGVPADAPSDQFAFCVTLFEAFYGERPFAGETLAALIESAVRGAVREPSTNRAVPPWLRPIIVRGLAADPRARWPSMEALLSELERAPSRRRRRALVLAGVGVAALGTAAVWSATARPLCGGAREQLSGVWDDDRRASVEQAFAALSLGWGAGTIERVTARLDAYVGDWADMHEQACMATARGEQSSELLDRRMRCLARRRAELGALIDVLAAADGAVIEHAVLATAGLSPITSCADLEMLAAVVELPADAESAARVAAAHDELARARALELAGRYAEAAQVAGAVLDEANAIDYLPLRAEAGYRSALAKEELGDFAAAETALFDAFLDARRTAHTEVAQTTAARLAFVVGYERARAEEGERWARIAEAELAESDRDELRADLLDAEGAMALRAARHDEALAAFTSASDLRAAALGADHPRIASSYNNIGIAQFSRGDYPAARESFARALELRERALGPDHPDVATSLNALANVVASLGDDDTALAQYERAASIQRTALGDRHPRLATTLDNAAGTLLRLGRFDDALAHAKNAHEIVSSSLGPEHPETIRIQCGLATALWKGGLVDESEATLRRAGELVERVHGPEHPLMGSVLTNLGALLRGRGRNDEALELYQRALSLLERAVGPEHPDLEPVLSNLARTHLARDEPARAVDFARRAIAIVERTEGDGENLGADLRVLAAALEATGAADEAASARRRAATMMPPEPSPARSRP